MRDLWKRQERGRRPSRGPWHLWTGWRGRQNISPYTIHGVSANFRRQQWLRRLPAGAYNRAQNQRITRVLHQNTNFGFNTRTISDPVEIQRIEISGMGQNDINVSDTSQNRPSIVSALRNRALGLPTNLNRFSKYYS